VFNRDEWTSRFHRKLNGSLQRLIAVAVVGLVTALIAWTVLWAAYGFRYSAAQDPQLTAQGETIVLGSKPPPDLKYPHRQPGYFPIEDNVRRAAAVKELFAHGSTTEIQETEVERLMDTAPPDTTGRMILFCERHRLFPEAFLYGISGYGIPYQR